MAPLFRRALLQAQDSRASTSCLPLWARDSAQTFNFSVGCGQLAQLVCAVFALFRKQVHLPWGLLFCIVSLVLLIRNSPIAIICCRNSGPVITSVSLSHWRCLSCFTSKTAQQFEKKDMALETLYYAQCQFVRNPINLASITVTEYSINSITIQLSQQFSIFTFFN